MITGFIVLLLTILEIVLLSYLARTYRLYNQIKKNGLRAQGEITDYEIKQSNSKYHSYYQ